MIFRYVNVRSFDDEHDGDEHATVVAAIAVTAVAHEE